MAQELHTYRRKQLELYEWNRWLNTIVYLDEHNVRSTMKRKEAIAIFFREGLKPFIESHGYVFSAQFHIISHLATYIYKKFARDFVKQPLQRIYNNVNVDLQYYDDRGIPDEDWEFFWKKWGTMTDFYDDMSRNRFWMPYFCYNRFDLLHSEATNQVDKELDEEYYEEDVQMNEDLVRVKDKKGMY